MNSHPFPSLDFFSIFCSSDQDWSFPFLPRWPPSPFSGRSFDPPPQFLFFNYLLLFLTAPPLVCRCDIPPFFVLASRLFPSFLLILKSPLLPGALHSRRENYIDPVPPPLDSAFHYRGRRNFPPIAEIFICSRPTSSVFIIRSLPFHHIHSSPSFVV